MSSARSSIGLQHGAAGCGSLQSQQHVSGLLSRPFGRSARRAPPSSQCQQPTTRTVLRVEAIAAPDKAAGSVDATFRAWDGTPMVPKRTDLKK